MGSCCLRPAGIIMHSYNIDTCAIPVAIYCGCLCDDAEPAVLRCHDSTEDTHACMHACWQTVLLHQQYLRAVRRGSSQCVAVQCASKVWRYGVAVPRDRPCFDLQG